jgi:predicted phosphate transport protein (TIGR00153 family)
MRLQKSFPKSVSFYDQFENHARKTVEGCGLLLTLMDPADTQSVREQACAIAEIEHECDQITHAVVAQLRTTLITPLDCNEIYRLITKMDDVMDFVEAVSERMALYEMRATTQEARGLARVLLTCAECVLEAVGAFRNLKQPQRILDKCIEINRLENEADTQLRGALARLFRDEPNPIAIMKWKEIYELLETATDRCEDVANIIEGVVLENT